MYVLYSVKSDMYYVGITHNFSKRLYQHNHSPEKSFTSAHRPWTISAVFRCKSIEIASWCEQYIKQQKSRAFIEDVLLNPDSVHPLLSNLTKLVP
ncbi:MAG: GIY-YIG nuclease family protein [Bacteroidota bacterium]